MFISGEKERLGRIIWERRHLNDVFPIYPAVDIMKKMKDLVTLEDELLFEYLLNVNSEQQ